MGLTAKALLHPRVRDDGTQQVRVRLTAHRASVFLDAGFTVAPRHWNAKGTADKANWVRGTERDATELNGALARLVAAALRRGRECPDHTADAVRAAVLAGEGRGPAPAPAAPGVPTDLPAFADYYVAERARTDKYGTVKFYAQVARNLREWRAGVPLPLAALRGTDLEAFHGWLLERPTVFAGTARDRLAKLSTVLKRAVRLGLLPAPQNPFLDFRLPATGNKRPPVRPTEAQRLAFLAFDLRTIAAPFRRPGFRRDLGVRRDIWHLQYLLRGSRVGDVLQLRERDVRADRISFTEAKTGKLKSMGRTPAVNALLARYPPTGTPLAYVFPALDHTRPYAAEAPAPAQRQVLGEAINSRIQWMNLGLARIARAAGLPVFTTHSARHLFAEKAYAATKDLRLIQAMFNHTSLATTERYMQTLGYDALDAATAAVLATDPPLNNQ